MIGHGLKGSAIRVDELNEKFTIEVSRQEIKITSSTGAAMSYKPILSQEHNIAISFKNSMWMYK